MKNFVLKTLIALVFLILFDGLFLVFKDLQSCPGSVWAAFSGVNIAYLSLFLIPALAPRKEGVRVLSATLYLIGILYFTAELAASLVFLFRVQASVIWPVTVQTVLFTLYLAVLLANVLANDATQASLGKQQTQSERRRDWVLETEETLALVAGHAAARKAVERCRDDLRSTPLDSTPEVSGLEAEIETALLRMKDAAADNRPDETERQALGIRSLVAKRNNKLSYKRHY